MKTENGEKNENGYGSYARGETFLCVDLHVYLVPPELWRGHLQSAVHSIVDESISAGFIRVMPEAVVNSLRNELEKQIGMDALPGDYFFLKPVGRHLTRVRPKQEYQLKVKYFLPPQASAPEIFLLEATPEVRATFSSGASSQRSDAAGSYQDPYRLESYRSPYGDKPEFNSRRPLPGINGYESPKSNVATQTDELDRLRLEEQMRREAEERRRRELEAAARRRREEEEEEERRRRAWEAEEEERRRREEEERHRRWQEEQDEAERRRREQEAREAEERRRRQLEEEERRRREDEVRFPSPPPPPVTPPLDRTQEKEELLKELDRLRRDRKNIERRREDLVKKAKQLQAKTQSRRNAARDVWKKKYFEEKKKTAPVEEQTNKLKQELDQVHRKIMASLEGKDKDGRRHEHTELENLKIQSTKHQHDIEDLQRRVENIKMKLTSEMKLRNQAETELRALRAELTQKKVNVTLARSQQQQAALGPGLSSSYTPQLITPRS